MKGIKKLAKNYKPNGRSFNRLFISMLKKFYIKLTLNRYILFSIIFFMILFGSCFRIENIAKEPKIEFQKFDYQKLIIMGNNNHPILNGTLKFYFEDGDGNVGFGIEQDAKHTVFIEKYKITNKIPIRIEFNDSLVNYKIPVFSTSGNRRAIKGDITINSLDEVFYTENDTIMYKFYIWDRDYNKSNIDSTGYLILRDYIN